MTRMMLAVLLTATAAHAQGVKPQLVLPLGHTDEVKAAAYGPDGKTVLTGGKDRVARLWDVASGKTIMKFAGHTDGINAVAFAPDEKLVATASADGSAKVWDATTGKCVETFKDANGASVLAVTFAPDGKTLLTGSADRAAHLWNVATGKLARKFADETDGHTSYVNAVAFAPDGKTLFTGSADKTVKQWDAAKGRTLQTFTGHTSYVYSVAVAPDGKTLLTAGADRTARLWDLETAKELTVFQGHGDYVYTAAFSPDGKTVLTGSADKLAGLWDVATGKSIAALAGHSGYVYAVKFSPDGKTVLTASGDGTARIQRTPTSSRVRTFAGHTNQVNGVAFSPDGKTAASASSDYRWKLWDVATGKTLFTSQGHKSYVKAVAFSPDGKRILTGSADKLAVLWDATTGAVAATFSGHTDYVNAVAFSPDGKNVVTGSGDKTARLWDIAGKQLTEFKGHTSAVIAVAVSADGKTVATVGGSEEEVRLWDAVTGRLQRTLKGHTSSPKSLAFSPDGKTILTGASDYQAILWDAATGKAIRTLKGHTNYVHAVAFSPDGRLAVTSGGDHRTLVWDLVSGNSVNTFRWTNEYPLSVAFSPDGKSVLTGMSSKSVLLWDVNDGRAQAVLSSVADIVQSVALNSDPDRVLVATGESGRLWELETGESRVSVVPNRRMIAETFTEDKKLRLHVAPDGTARLTDVKSNAELCTLVTLGNGEDWLVATPEGLFDGSPRARELVAFKVGQSVVPVERFHRDFYRPRLLDALVKGERPKPNVSVAAKPAPLIRIIAPADRAVVPGGTVTVTLEATDQGGGLTSLALYHQGTRIFLPGEPEKDGKVYRRTVKVKLVEGENRLEAKASGEGGWESEPVQVTVLYAKPVVKPDLHVLAIGVSEYADDRIKLAFAAADAKALGQVFERRGKRMYANVHVRYLTDAKATRAGIREALDAIAKTAQTRDTLVLTVSGHGTTLGQRYFFLPHEFDGKKFSTTEENVKKQGLPVDELGELLRQVPALKKVLVLDTCGSGGATGLLQKGQSRNPFAFRGEIERLNRTEGVFTIAACAAGEEAQEAKELGHGLLTYALLAALRAVDNGPLKDKGAGGAKLAVGVMDWFTFAADETPALMKKYFGREQDVHTSGIGNSFPLLPGRDE